jgi:hypothetical protein
MHILRLTTALLLSVAVTSPTPGLAQPMSPQTDRPGRNFFDFAMDARACQMICEQNQRCLAWTYAVPGTRGPLGHCWLKDAVPQAVHDPAATSGVKGQRIDP